MNNKEKRRRKKTNISKLSILSDFLQKIKTTLNSLNIVNRLVGFFFFLYCFLFFLFLFTFCFFFFSICSVSYFFSLLPCFLPFLFSCFFPFFGPLLSVRFPFDEFRFLLTLSCDSFILIFIGSRFSYFEKIFVPLSLFRFFSFDLLFVNFLFFLPFLFPTSKKYFLGS